MSTVDSRALETLRNGGATFGVLPERYVVALGSPLERVVPADVASITRALFELEATGEADLPGRALGTWIDADLAYIDIVESFATLGSALAAGRDRAQLAIFDAVADRAIDVLETVR